MIAGNHYSRKFRLPRYDDRRAFERVCVLVSARMSDLTETKPAMDCLVFDLSANGAKVRIERPWTGDRIKQLTLCGVVDHEVQLAWSHGGFAGLQFTADPEAIAGTLAGILPGRCLEL